MDWQPGAVVRGRDGQEFVVVDFINRGSFGNVYRVRRLEDGLEFALKTIETRDLDIVGLRALLNEGRLALEIDDPNVIRVYHFHDGGGRRNPGQPRSSDRHRGPGPYVIMDLADGGSLQDVIDARRPLGAQFRTDNLTVMFRQLASGMKAINAKLIHRDIRPSNILIHRGRLKISDFGLAKAVGTRPSADSARENLHVKYRAPEAWGAGVDTVAMDMYSMGIVFYEMATLRHPYAPDGRTDPVSAWRSAHVYTAVEPADKWNLRLPRDLAKLLAKMMSKRPQDRPSWDEVLERLEPPAGEDTRGALTRPEPGDLGLWGPIPLPLIVG